MVSDSLMDNPPLIKRINVVGTSGSGKSTVGRAMAKHLNLPYVELDALFWKPDWTESSEDELQAKLEKALSTDGWVLDGNYHSKTVHIKWRHVQMIVWVDYSYPRTLMQALKRAFTRSWKGEEIWAGTGNIETFRKTFFDRDSVLLWTITSYHNVKKRYEIMMTDERLAGVEKIRLRSPRETAAFLEKLSRSAVI